MNPTSQLNSSPLPPDIFGTVMASPLATRVARPARILVVDDERLIRWYLSENLSKAGYQVIEAEDGESAFRQLETAGADLDLILLDLKLPDTDGIHILSRIRQGALTCPVVLMTAFGTSDTRDEAIRLGAEGFVEKPFDAGSILELVGRLLDRGGTAT